MKILKLTTSETDLAFTILGGESYGSPLNKSLHTGKYHDTKNRCLFMVLR